MKNIYQAFAYPKQARLLLEKVVFFRFIDNPVKNYPKSGLVLSDRFSPYH